MYRLHAYDVTWCVSYTACVRVIYSIAYVCHIQHVCLMYTPCACRQHVYVRLIYTMCVRKYNILHVCVSYTPRCLPRYGVCVHKEMLMYVFYARAHTHTYTYRECLASDPLLFLLSPPRLPPSPSTSSSSP